MIITLVYSEYLKGQGAGAPEGPEHVRIVEVPEGMNAKTLIEKLGAHSIAECESDLDSGRHFAYGAWRRDGELRDGQTYKFSLRNQREQLHFVKRFESVSF